MVLQPGFINLVYGHLIQHCKRATGRQHEHRTLADVGVEHPMLDSSARWQYTLYALGLRASVIGCGALTSEFSMKLIAQY